MSFEKRALFAVSYFWLGLHLVYLGLWANGASDSNFLFSSLNKLVNAEIYILIAVITVTAFILIAKSKPTQNTANAATEAKENVSSVEEKHFYEEPKTSFIENKITQNEFTKVTDKPKEVAIIPPSTPQELKQKAIEQITGRRF